MTVNSGLTCAPCVTDLALVREAVTSVAGTACCQAHAVLLTYSTDTPGRRRARVEQLRDLAEAKMEMASENEKAALELLVAEYALIAVMDMGGNRDAQPGQQRREAQREGNREPRGPRTGQPREPRPEGDAPRADGEGRGRRGRRGRPERAAGETVEQTTHVTVTSAPTTESAASPVGEPAAAPSAPVTAAPVTTAPVTAPAVQVPVPAAAPAGEPAAAAPSEG